MLLIQSAWRRKVAYILRSSRKIRDGVPRFRKYEDVLWQEDVSKILDAIELQRHLAVAGRNEASRREEKRKRKGAFKN